MAILAREITTPGQLRDEFIHAGRDNFSYDGYAALLEIIGGYADIVPTLLDPIAIDCEYTEYESLDELAAAYSSNGSRFERCDLLPWLQEQTLAVSLENGGVIVADI